MGVDLEQKTRVEVGKNFGWQDMGWGFFGKHLQGEMKQIVLVSISHKFLRRATNQEILGGCGFYK